MKPTVVLIPGIYPKASESIFRAIRESWAETDYEILVLENADERDLESKVGRIKSKILVGKSYGGKLAIEYQIRHKDAEALVLLAPAVNVKEQFREIKIPVLIIHGTDDRVVPIDNSRELEKQFERSSFVAVQGAEHGYRGKELETAKIIVNWIKSLTHS